MAPTTRALREVLAPPVPGKPAHLTQVAARRLPTRNIQTCYRPEAKVVEPAPGMSSEQSLEREKVQHTMFVVLVAEVSDRDYSTHRSARVGFRRPSAVHAGSAMRVSASKACSEVEAGRSRWAQLRWY